MHGSLVGQELCDVPGVLAQSDLIQLFLGYAQLGTNLPEGENSTEVSDLSVRCLDDTR